MLAAGLPPRLRQRIVASRPADKVKLEPAGTGLRSTSNCGGLGGTRKNKNQQRHAAHNEFLEQSIAEQSSGSNYKQTQFRAF